MTLQILSIDNQSEWTANKGPQAGKGMISYYVTVDDGNGKYEGYINKLNSSPAPQEGDPVKETGQKNSNGVPKLEIVKDQPFQQRPSGGGSSKSDGPSPAYWASKDKRISRQHSQEMSIRLWAMNKRDGEIITREQVKELADWFDSDLPELLDE